MPDTAKLFTNGGSQAVRLPAEFRFEDASEVYIRREPVTGDIVLSRQPRLPWREFMAMRAAMLDEHVADFMRDRDREEPPAQDRDPFEGISA
ncbi:MAG: DNA-binding protein [Variovorax sp.]|nr:DNA-binding protein [Variovorax sp.]